MKNNQEYFIIKNNSSSADLEDIPVMDYVSFREKIISALNEENKHCISYYSVPSEDYLRLICCIADDSDKSIEIFSCKSGKDIKLIESAASLSPQVHIFEREIHENTGIVFTGHPWLKPVRFSHSRADKSKTVDGYPFYSIHSEELHEVGVGRYMPE